MSKTNATILIMLFIIFVGVYTPDKKSEPKNVESRSDYKTRDRVELSREMLILINQERNAVGCKNITMSPILEENAQNRAESLYINNQWSHDGYLKFASRNYDYVHVGENLARDFVDVDSAMTGLMESQSHRENILNCDYVEGGFGFYGNIIVQFFGRPR